MFAIDCEMNDSIFDEACCATAWNNVGESKFAVEYAQTTFASSCALKKTIFVCEAD
eukprot:CAMPEP_0184277560 /NCGR_PEP_ID=MMETSP0977-20130417/51585_1 /TAXON_ID=483370 /ORGANISM="non described non described, Strain CCMP2097" /LENGTH=55 /DNA_ID=CAMNT_0026583481 /DNA_START=52 /DNA_END=216 /DNA_ORIENTATION=+